MLLSRVISVSLSISFLFSVYLTSCPSFFSSSCALLTRCCRSRTVSFPLKTSPNPVLIRFSKKKERVKDRVKEVVDICHAPLRLVLKKNRLWSPMAKSQSALSILLTHLVSTSGLHNHSFFFLFFSFASWWDSDVIKHITCYVFSWFHDNVKMV